MEEKRYKSCGNYVINNVAGSKVLVPIANSVAQLENLLLFNDSAVEMVEMLERGMSVGEVATLIEDECEETPAHDIIVKEISELATRLVECGYFVEL